MEKKTEIHVERCEVLGVDVGGMIFNSVPRNIEYIDGKLLPVYVILKDGAFRLARIEGKYLVLVH